MLRFAIYVDYKYNYLDKSEQKKLQIQKSRKTGKALLVSEGKGKVLTKSYFDELTSVFEPRRLLEMWYAHFNPYKENIDEVIENALIKYVEYEDVVFNKLYRMYVDENAKMEPLWFSKKYRPRKDGTRELLSDFYARKS